MRDWRAVNRSSEPGRETRRVRKATDTRVFDGGSEGAELKTPERLDSPLVLSWHSLSISTWFRGFA